MNPAVDNATGTGSARPRDPIEIWLARQWQEVLGVGIGESFVRNRRKSLDAERIINAVLDQFGVQLSLNVTMESPPVESLATRLRELRTLVG
jgi:hypothetical protein